MAVDVEARNMAETAILGVAEVRRDVGSIRSDIGELKRSNARSQWVIGGLVTLATAAIAAITNVQVATIGQQKTSQVDYAAEQQRKKELEGIEARIAAKVDGLSTDLERYRRNAPAPLGSDPDRVARAK